MPIAVIGNEQVEDDDHRVHFILSYLSVFLQIQCNVKFEFLTKCFFKIIIKLNGK